MSTAAVGAVRGAATVFSDYAAVLGARFGSVLLSLCSVIITTRILDPAGYGTLAYFTVVAMLIFTATSAWTSAAVARYGREQLEARGTMTHVSWSRLWITAPLVGVAAALVPLLKVLGALPPDFSWSFVWLAVAYGVILIIADHVIYLLEAAGRMKLSAIGLLAQQAVLVASLLLLVLVGSGQQPLVIAIISLLATTLATLIFGAMVWRVGFWPPSHDRALRRRILLFSVPLIAFTVSQYVIRFVDIVVIGAYESAAAVGLYAVAYQGYTVLQQVAGASGPVLTPLLVSLRMADKEKIILRYLDRAVPQLTFLAAVLAGVAIPFVPMGVQVVFGSDFAEASQPLTILFLPMVLVFATNLLGPILVLYERSSAIGVINSFAAAINVVADIVLIGFLDMGISGAAVATSLAVTIIVVGYVTACRDCTGSQSRFNPLLLGPVVAGLAPTLMLSGVEGTIIGVVSSLTVSYIIVALVRPFEAQDAEIIAQLDMPPTLKKLALRGLAIISS
jgi:O-antigen/teichoic acid export membrane protein